MAVTIDQVAAHEAGHAVVLMAFGVPVTSITGMEGQREDSFLVGAFESFATDFDTAAYYALEPRLQYVAAVGGFAGEVTHEGIIEPRGAKDDLTRLRRVALTDNEIQLLTGLAMEIVADNRRLWEEIYNGVLFVASQSQTSRVEGAAMNRRFAEIGKRFTDLAKLDEILPDLAG